MYICTYKYKYNYTSLSTNELRCLFNPRPKEKQFSISNLLAQIFVQFKWRHHGRRWAPGPTAFPSRPISPRPSPRPALPRSPLVLPRPVPPAPPVLPRLVPSYPALPAPPRSRRSFHHAPHLTPRPVRLFPPYPVPSRPAPPRPVPLRLSRAALPTTPHTSRPAPSASSGHTPSHLAPPLLARAALPAMPHTPSRLPRPAMICPVPPRLPLVPPRPVPPASSRHAPSLFVRRSSRYVPSRPSLVPSCPTSRRRRGGAGDAERGAPTRACAARASPFALRSSRSSDRALAARALPAGRP